LNDAWRPTATFETLRARATMLQAARDYFRARHVLEVETPVAVRHAVTDPHLASLSLTGAPRYLHTSPEYAMKRLIAAGSGDIHQICRVFRDDERSPRHNPEFTMMEWYRLGFDLDRIVDDTFGLIACILAAAGAAVRETEQISYRAAFERELSLDPLEADEELLRATACGHGLAASSARGATRDELLDFLMAVAVGPALGRGSVCAVHHYPASQAALARIAPDDPRTALRFEIYADGLELANGFVELADAAEQQRRFQQDLGERRRRGLATPAPDTDFLAALASGLPDCAGVALGFDRLVMLALGARRIDEVMAFPWDRA